MPLKADIIADFAEKIADDDTHGYSQINRNGSPDYDCSSLSIAAADAAGYHVKQCGATYTGDMRDAFSQAGAVVLPYAPGLSLQRGDILLNERKGHAAIYTGNNQLVEATGDENGGITGALSGDQTGHEIHRRKFYNFPWEWVLRFESETPQEPQTSHLDWKYTYSAPQKTDLPMITRGDYGPAVCAAQGALNYHGFGPLSNNGYFSERMSDAVKRFQTVHHLEVDGIIGPETWNELFYWR